MSRAPLHCGPAFPCMPPQDTAAGVAVGYPYPDAGMTLRDYFAAKAMQAHLVTDTVPGEPCDALVEAAIRLGRDPIYHLARNAYDVADAMLKAREA